MRNALVLAGAIVLAAPLAQAQTVDRSEAPAMVGWINAARAEHGAAPVTEDARLDALAEAHSVDMVQHGFFDHVSPTHGAPAERAQAAGVGFQSLAENIALNRTPHAAFDALMHSPGHYANIMNPALRAVGIGIVRGSQGVYVTQTFATFPQGVAIMAPGYAPGAVPATVATRPVAPAAPAAPAAPVADDDDDVAAPSDTGTAAPSFPRLPDLIALLQSARPVAGHAGVYEIPTPLGAMRVQMAPGAGTGAQSSLPQGWPAMMQALPGLMQAIPGAAQMLPGTLPGMAPGMTPPGATATAPIGVHAPTAMNGHPRHAPRRPVPPAPAPVPVAAPPSAPPLGATGAF